MSQEKKPVTSGDLIGQCLFVLAVAVGIRVGVALLSQPLPPVPPPHAETNGLGSISFVDIYKDGR